MARLDPSHAAVVTRILDGPDRWRGPQSRPGRAAVTHADIAGWVVPVDRRGLQVEPLPTPRRRSMIDTGRQAAGEPAAR